MIGPSGSGKSTILRLIKGLEAVSNGAVTVDGVPVVTGRRQHRWFLRGPVRHQVGMVFQHFNLFPHLTVEQNIMEAPLRVLKLAAEDARQRAHYYLDIVGLAHKAPAWPATLSGGQQQRVAIARDVADRVLFIEKGKIIDDGTPADVVVNPLNPRTRQFLNILTER
nr:ATP-binding cassette domain-containing protein [Sodalis sp. dw_96]